MASLHKNRRTTLERIEKFVSRIYFTDVNLYGRIYPHQENVDIFHWALPQDKHWKSISFDEIIKQTFLPQKIGDCFGPTWATHYFKIVVKIPESWSGKEIHLRWNSNSEALLFNTLGEPLQGFTGSPDHQKREEFIISKSWEKKGPEELVYFIEMACNSMFGAGKGGMIDAPDPDRKYSLQMANVAVCDTVAYHLLIDLELLFDMAKELTEADGKGDSRGYQALYAGNQIINAIQADDWKEAQRVSNEFFKYRNGERAHIIDAMGHCHIDTAWLWTYDETIRKCARSWSSVIALMKDYPEMTFVCSQAQQFSWVKQYYPSLYEEMKHFISLGRFIPVGGTWVEMDGNIPSGESFIRQFLYGQRFFLKEFGIRSQEFWLPDTFGYSAQTPQILKHVGISRFLTQKLSWSLVNKFPHHNFLWEGIDGSTVIVHFPPGDSYEANCKVSEALKTERNLLDKGRVTRSVMLYGFGDGGGGPHKPMLDRMERLKDVDGVPKFENSTPNKFFENLEAESSQLCRWVGELYLELHNGTYTSQADMKKYNRSCEYKLRDAELLLAIAFTLERIPLADLVDLRTNIEEGWRLLLVNQFHDVLPGSSIELAHTEAKEWFRKSLQLAAEVVDRCISYLQGTSIASYSLLNTLPWSRNALIYENEKPLKAISVKPMSWDDDELGDISPVVMEQGGGVHKISNKWFSVEIDSSGRISSMIHHASGNQVVPTKEFGNQLVLFDDIPLYWDAWDCMDYHIETRNAVNRPSCTEEEVHVELATPLKVTLKWSQPVGQKSRVHQKIHITAVHSFIEFETRVEWAENRKFLKVEFPVEVHANQASFDTQFGFLNRPNHKNTSWDSAKFEVCGHKWADLSEPAWGVSVLNDSKYGWSVHGRTITMSLLRSPKAPDANCDMHEHFFRYALMPHNGLKSRSEVIRESYNFNCELISTKLSKDTSTSGSWFTVNSSSVILETIKPCEPVLGDEKTPVKRILVRLFESCGDRTHARIETSLPFVNYMECNGLEEPIGPLLPFVVSTEGQKFFTASFTPFQIKSFLLSF
ncbi:alpha-mannosidase 2C1-like [Daphnia pulicaria]|uniref:alpha-mannosidase 2C1-like n=1 Tax=Daphnia pulicaria TaxID=35523 RepID=UPI001EECD6B7|nr:alpha-mannosidase 2C1-like [Daphnia pulicaria]